MWSASDDWNESWSTTPLSDDEPLLEDVVSLGQPPLLVPLHTMRLVDLLARKRALESRIATASFVRAITHTSQVGARPRRDRLRVRALPRSVRSLSVLLRSRADYRFDSRCRGG